MITQHPNPLSETKSFIDQIESDASVTSRAAAALGRLAKGVPKRLSDAERERRTEQILKAGRVRVERIRRQKFYHTHGYWPE